MNSLFGNVIGSSRTPSGSAAMTADKLLRKPATERKMASSAKNEQDLSDYWGGTPPGVGELSVVAQLRKDKANLRKERAKGLKGTGAPAEGMFVVEADIQTTTGMFSQTYGRILTFILHINDVPCCCRPVRAH